MLMAAGCSVNHHNMYGQTPTEMAANAGHQQIVLVLMQSQLLMQADVFVHLKKLISAKIIMQVFS